jgi:hypothetical protein
MALPSPEEVLAYQIQQENQGLLTPQAVGTMGAAAGAVAGSMVGNVPHQAGRAVNAIAGRKPRVLKPGFRMAGGLVGAILGGGLGIGVREEMIKNSPEAQMLAKLQAGTYTVNDQAQLEALLANTYSRMGVM